MTRKSAAPAPKRRPRKLGARATFTLPEGDQRPRYELLMDLLMEQLRSGQLKPGDPVPSVRQLIRDLGISHTTVTRAMRALVEQGLLETRVGSGTRVALRKPRKAIGILSLNKYAQMIQSAFMRQTINLLQQRVLQTGRTLLYRHLIQDPGQDQQHDFNDLAQVDGLLLAGHLPEDVTGRITSALPGHLPVVGMSCRDTGQFPVFSSDNDAASGRLIDYLASLGHRHIATLFMDSPSYLEATNVRLQSVRRALKKLGLPLDDRSFINGSVQEQVQGLLQLQPRPTAIFIASGIHRFPQYFAALQNTPLDLHHTLVASYDEDLWLQISPMGIEHVRIDQPMSELVDLAFDTLLQLIERPSLKIPSDTRPSRIVHVNAQGDARPV